MGGLVEWSSGDPTPRPVGRAATQLVGTDVQIHLSPALSKIAGDLAADRGLRPADIVDEIVRRALELEGMRFERTPA